jgi:hypothetical protein
VRVPRPARAPSRFGSLRRDFYDKGLVPPTESPIETHLPEKRSRRTAHSMRLWLRRGQCERHGAELHLVLVNTGEVASAIFTQCHGGNSHSAGQPKQSDPLILARGCEFCDVANATPLRGYSDTSKLACVEATACRDLPRPPWNLPDALLLQRTGGGDDGLVQLTEACVRVTFVRAKDDYD